ncbi:MAG: putative bifunctional xylanase/esterase [Fibrobacterota bacterium]|jgi:endo-1,4-beta-D-glucanase Y
MRRIFTLVAALSAMSFSAALNYLPNPGFESGTVRWTLYVNSSNTTTTGTPEALIDVAPEAAHEGTQGAAITVSGVNGNNWDVQLQPPQSWKAEKGKVYHMTFWGKADASRKLAVSAGLGKAGNYKYLTGWDFGLSTTWKQYEVWYTSPATGVDSLRLNLYVGAEKGTYHFDDFVLDTVPSTLPTTMTQPAKGAWSTGQYRNLFKELGYADEAIDAKVNAAFSQLFLTGDSATERLFRLAPTDTGMGFIDATDYVLTEGQSYGMMVAVQLNRKDLFDKMWKFAKTHMQQKSGDLQGYFAWKVSTTPPYTPKDYNPAPDGEEYFVTSLFFAAKRWGNGTGIYNYQEQADSLLGYITKTGSASMLPLIHPTRKQILFSPAQVSDPYSDPSYHLPGFYRVWDAFAKDRKNGFYAEMADTSWALLKRASHATTGLFPDYCTFDGAPKSTDFNANSHKFSSDAHRVGSNIGFSWAWFMDDAGAMSLVKKELAFFAGQGAYKAQYSLEGVADVTYGATSLLASNAAAVLASDRASDWSFVSDLWKTPTSTGTYRYYNGMVQMLNLLHVSGKFKIWGSPGLEGGTGIQAIAKGADFRTTLKDRTVRVEGQGMARLLDVRGQVIDRRELVAGSATLQVPGAGVWIVDMGKAGSRTILVP